jgi:hypothetical protein
MLIASHTATYDLITGQRGPRIDIDRNTAIVIHLPATGEQAGTCTLYEVDLKAGHDAYLAALTVRSLRKTAKQVATKLETAWRQTPAAPPVTAGDLRVWLVDRIQVLAGNSAAVAEVRNRWPADISQPLPTEPTVAQVDAMAAVLDRVEANHQIPFGPPRPGTSTTPKEQSA